MCLTYTQPSLAKASAGDAEEEGFEPPEPCSSTVFKTAAFDRSATPLCIPSADHFGSANLYLSGVLANAVPKLSNARHPHSQQIPS